MKKMFTRRIFFKVTGRDSIRPIDMFLMEVIDIAMDFVQENINLNRKLLKKSMNFKEKMKMAELVMKDSFDFIEYCIQCKYRCCFEKEVDGKQFFEDNFFKNGQHSDSELPEELHEMKKIDFFIFELSVGIANKITEELGKRYPENFISSIYHRIIEPIVKFVKTKCPSCHIACLDDPLEDGFVCFACTTRRPGVVCPYEDNNRKLAVKKRMV